MPPDDARSVGPVPGSGDATSAAAASIRPHPEWVSRYGEGLFALSLATLLLMGAWDALLSYYTVDRFYYEAAPARWKDLTTLVALEAALALLVYAAVRAYNRTRSAIGRRCFEVVFLAIMLVPLNLLRTYLPLPYKHLDDWVGLFGRSLPFLLLALAGCAAFAVAKTSVRRVAVICGIVVLILSPVSVILAAQACWQVWSIQRGFERRMPPGPAPRVSPRPASPRVVVVVFDEMDYEATFVSRPAGVELPELDALRGRSLVATNAFPPAEMTRASIPSMLTGRIVTKTRPISVDNLMLDFLDNGEARDYRSCEDLFQRLRALGRTSAAVGWYHPYRRLISADADLTYRMPSHLEPRRFGSWWECAEVHVAEAVRRFPGGGRLIAPYDTAAHRLAKMREHEKVFAETISAAKNAASDASFDFVFLHLPIPHEPFIYDAASSSLRTSLDNSYLDNLALADATLGEIRVAMEAAGLWDDSYLLVTSDHFLRLEMVPEKYAWGGGARRVKLTEDHRVPFILKMPNQAESLEYGDRFNTVAVHDLVLELVSGKARTAPEIADWLRQHGRMYDIRYNLRLKGPSPPT